MKSEPDPGYSRKLFAAQPSIIQADAQEVVRVQSQDDIFRWEQRDMNTVRLMEARPYSGGDEDEA